MGNKVNHKGTFAHVMKIRRSNEYRPKWAKAYLSVTAHGDGAFTVADATFYLRKEDLQILIRTAQETLAQIESAEIKEEN